MTIKIEHNGRVYNVDENGFLVNHKDWDLNWADYVRMKEGIPKLSEDHHTVIHALRAYYKENNEPPLMRNFYICTKLTRGSDFIYKLFPSGPGDGACKMAGLPTPFHLHKGYYFPCGNLKIA